ncbi:MAG: hypothetical protein ABS79_02435 [Planctomycetes bacterium SCN 63-9]|nr:MAG: hypothetical protein ABS79_02435 [Planctomycetes bacterium SCN 63-9]
MARRLIWTVVGTLGLMGGIAGTARAAEWADALFAESSHNFGSVPRGAKVKHDFMLTNRLNEPITILNLRASCGCTSGRTTASIVQPGQTAVVEAHMDTRNFVGQKSTVLFVTLITAGGHEAEVRLGVTSNILSDVVLNPGSIDFGTVTRGQTPSQTLTVDRIDAPGWKFEKMISASRVINAQLVETGRQGGSVSYLLTVSLKPGAPAGLVRDEIRLIGNDPQMPSVPVAVTAMIRGDLSASPSVLSMGEVASASGAQGRFIVRASKPFTIKSVEGAGEGFSITPADKSAKPMHIVTVNFKPEEATARGSLQRTFRVHTDLPGEGPLDLKATLHVAP